MKTWTNPTVEELEVKMTALFRWTDIDELEINGKIEPERIPGGAESDEGFGKS